MADFRRTRDYQPDSPLDLHYLTDPTVTNQALMGGPGMGGAGNEGGMGLSQQAAVGGVEGSLDRIAQLGDERRNLEDQLAAIRSQQGSQPQSQGMSLGSNIWQGLKDAGSSIGNGLKSMMPTQEGYNDFAMRLQNANSIVNGGTPLWMMQQQHQVEQQRLQDMMGMKRQQLAQHLGDLEFKRQQHMEDQALKVWQDPHMPLAMKKKMSQQMSMQGNALAGNLARLGDETLVAEMQTLLPFLPKGKGEELMQMMSQPNADLDQLEQWVGFAREKKKIAGQQRMQHERFAELLQKHTSEGLDPMSPEFDEFQQMVGEREKRHQAAAEMNLKLEQMGLTKKKAEQELAASSVMPQYGPEVHLPNGNVQRDRLDPQTMQVTQVTGNKPPASVTNVNMKQESAFEGELGKKNAGRVDDTRVKAEDAASIVRNVHQGRQLIDSGMITGVGAEYLTKFGQALQQIGFMKGKDAISNTQAFAANMAGNVAKQIKEFGAGTGLSDADREYATKMAGGDITLDEKSIRKILDINEKAARNIIKNHNKSVKGIKSMIPLEVEEPGEYISPKKQSSSIGGPFSDPEKEKRYQEWKRRQGK